MLVLSSSQTVFGSQQNTTDGYIHYGPSRQSIPSYLVSPQSNPTFEEQYGNPTYQIDYNGSKLIATNILNKTTFKEGETITVIPEVTNLGNQTVSIGYGPPLFVIEVTDQHGKIVWESGGIHVLVAFSMTLKPNMSSPGYVPAHGAMQKGIFTLTAPGNYTITSIASFDGSAGSNLSLWSKPLQITVLPEKVPEFPLAIPVLVLSITSMLIYIYMVH